VSLLYQLADLNLINNSFSGPLPTAFGAMTLLSALSLAQNEFNGSIPDSLIPTNLPNLLRLDHSHNNLSGNIPFGYANLSSFLGLTFNMSANNLSGRVPGDVGVMNASAAANPGLCGGAGYEPCPDPPRRGRA